MDCAGRSTRRPSRAVKCAGNGKRASKKKKKKVQSKNPRDKRSE
jgi:hypothetical protein